MQAKVVPTIVIDTVPQQQPEDHKKVLKETTKGNIMTGTTNAIERKIDEKMYIIPPNKKKRALSENNSSNSSSDNSNNDSKSNNNNNANENNNNFAADNIEKTLSSQPEMGQDFDPYGETLITY